MGLRFELLLEYQSPIGKEQPRNLNMSTSKSALLLLWANLASFLKKNIGYFPVGTKLLFRFVCVPSKRWKMKWWARKSLRTGQGVWLALEELRSAGRSTYRGPHVSKKLTTFFCRFWERWSFGGGKSRKYYNPERKCPIFWGNFTPKTGNYCLENRALGFPGTFLLIYQCFFFWGSWNDLARYEAFNLE